MSAPDGDREVPFDEDSMPRSDSAPENEDRWSDRYGGDERESEEWLLSERPPHH